MNGTYTADPTDHGGLGEFSDEQLLEELKVRGIEINKEHECIYISARSNLFESFMVCQRCLKVRKVIIDN